MTRFIVDECTGIAREHAGILLLRLTDDRAATKVRIISSIMRHHIDKLAGHFVVATERDIRIRPVL